MIQNNLKDQNKETLSTREGNKEERKSISKRKTDVNHLKIKEKKTKRMQLRRRKLDVRLISKRKKKQSARNYSIQLFRISRLSRSMRVTPTAHSLRLKSPSIEQKARNCIQFNVKRNHLFSILKLSILNISSTFSTEFNQLLKNELYFF